MKNGGNMGGKALLLGVGSNRSAMYRIPKPLYDIQFLHGINKCEIDEVS